MRAKNKGYSLIEIVVILLVIGLGVSAVAMGISGKFSMMQPEVVMVQTANIMLEAKSHALLGTRDETKRTFRLQDALALPHNGVEITVTPTSYGQVNCNISACPNQQFICISGQPVCFTATNNFVFEAFSGKLTEPHALFISSSKRKLALMVSNTGDFTVAELTGNQWRSRIDMQGLILESQHIKTITKQ
jgi:hypothetical protein